MSHYPGHMREAFIAWADAGMPATATVEVGYEPQQWPAERLLGRMAHCTDVIPGHFCDELGTPLGSTYASAAQRLLRERKEAMA